ncbi:MAG: Rrf2 family transcriptional regulator [Hydrogenothermaceae bacterium]
MITEAAKDSIRAVIYIALYREDREFVSIKEIAQNLKLSFYFLSKNLLKLVKAGILESFRGPKGGVNFKKNLKDVKLIDIISVIDGTSLFESCILGFKECSDANPCAIHNKWAEERKKLYEMFDISVEKIVDDIKSGKIKNIKI